MIEILKKENITGIDPNKVIKTSFLGIEGGLFISREASVRIFSQVLSELEQNGRAIIIEHGKFDMDKAFFDAIKNEVEEFKKKNPNKGLEPDDPLFTDPN